MTFTPSLWRHMLNVLALAALSLAFLSCGSSGSNKKPLDQNQTVELPAADNAGADGQASSLESPALTGDDTLQGSELQDTEVSSNLQKDKPAVAAVQKDALSGLKTFFEYCQHDMGTESISITVQALWEYVDGAKKKKKEEPATDCRDVANYLEAMDGRSILTLTKSKEAKPITDLSPLGRLTNIKKIRFSGHALSDLSILAANNGLLELSIMKNGSSMDVSSLRGHRTLKILFLGVTTEFRQGLDPTLILSLDKLQSLGLDALFINDYRWLQGNSRLKELTLNNQNRNTSGELTPILQENLSTIISLKNVLDLTLDGNDLVDISALATMPQLEYLSLSDNDISDVSSLQDLKNLTKLYLNANNIIDFSPLSGLALLDKKIDLDLGGNPGLLNKTPETCPTSAQSKGLEQICSK